MALPTKMTAKSTIFLFSSFLILGLIAGWFGYRNYAKPSRKIIAQVGPYGITDEAVRYQMQVNRFMIPQKTDYAFALDQLKEMYTDQLIMEKYGSRIQTHDLIAERQRIETGTRARHLLQKIQEIPGFDPRFYDEIFVRETLIQRTIFNDFYFSKDEIHETTRKQAFDFASQMTGQPNSKVRGEALARNLRVFNLRIDPTNGLTTQYLQKDEASASQAAMNDPHPMEMTPDQKKAAATRWLQAHSRFQKVHDAFLFDEHEQWALLFPEKWTPQSQNVSGLLVVFLKEPFQSWIQKEKSKVLQEPESGAN